MTPEPGPAIPHDDHPEDDVADASLLFGDDEPGPTTARPAPSSSTASSGTRSGEAEAYEVEPRDDQADQPEARSNRDASLERSRAAAREAMPARDRPPPDASRVSQTWTRWAEWGPTLVTVAVAALATVALTWLLFDIDNLMPAVLAFLIGMAATVVLSYPIVTTLERPVRMTPEQAARDFLGALEHHRPHYRRMWLLLSDQGRACGSYGSFEGFRTYWTARMASLRGSRVGANTPLVFRVEGFKGPKSAGLDTTEASFTVVVLARGHRREAPLAILPVRMSFSRGPDRQWYLDRGTLPDA
jgi:hypothetical protein